jgi:peroxiredoxin
MKLVTLVAAYTALGCMSAVAQQKPLPVGAAAPTFSLSAATFAGVRPKAFSLDEVKGRTVVLAFFYKARTSG